VVREGKRADPEYEVKGLHKLQDKKEQDVEREGMES
jgi:hypothetical protein